MLVRVTTREPDWDSEIDIASSGRTAGSEIAAMTGARHASPVDPIEDADTERDLCPSAMEETSRTVQPESFSEAQGFERFAPLRSGVDNVER